ncbi:MAG: hypothetical protein KAJ45_00920, partial [Desulfobulbaceae bacterium]|nr:hypothetical protein [Desulfobulbaceae bacterium]
MEQGYKSLIDLECVDDRLAEVLYDGGFTSAADLAEAGPEELTELGKIDEELAARMVEEAKEKLLEPQVSESEESEVAEGTEETGPTDEDGVAEEPLETAESESVESDDTLPLSESEESEAPEVIEETGPTDEAGVAEEPLKIAESESDEDDAGA